jgi:myo-inositol-1(or 4)-monophosphatase
MVLEHRNLSRMLEVATVSARLGGQRAMEEINFIKASIKKGGELATETDIRCQQIIIDRIKENYPDHGFIGEEGPNGKMFKLAPRGGELVWWVIDPIDGTINFAHRILCFTVSVAVMYQGEPIAGVIFDPATDSMFTTVKGGEAQFNTTRITASEEQLSESANLGVSSHWRGGIPAGIVELMSRTKFRNFGSVALQLAYVAKGSFIATIDSGPKLWDIAAGAFIAETAGAVVTNWQGEKIFPLELDNYNGEEFTLLAADKKVHPELLELLKMQG